MVLNYRIGNTEHHIGIISPVTDIPSSTMRILNYLGVVLYSGGIFPSDILISHIFSPQSESISDSLTVNYSFEFIYNINHLLLN